MPFNNPLIKLGESLFTLGGVLLTIGFIFLRFPNLFIILKDTPGNIYIDGKFIFPGGTVIVIGLIVAASSLLFGLLAKCIR